MRRKIRIPIAQPDLTGRENEFVGRCLSSSWISSKGAFITNFEHSFASFIGTRYAVATSNGTVALHLAITALGIGFGDEVLVPDLTFVATANAVTYTGATPVLVDIEKDTWCISPVEMEKKITRRTKAVVVVHLYGRPASMAKIAELAKKYDLKVIEDAAEAHGAEVFVTSHKSLKKRKARKEKEEWRKIGSIGDASCFSFYGNKIITTGEGGMVTTNNKMLAQKMRMLKDHGQDPKRHYYHPVIGFNYRMTNIEAAIGCAQLERIHSFLRKRASIAQTYSKLLQSVAGITPHPRNSDERSVYWMYSILIDKPYPLTRNELMKNLEKDGIESRPFFYPLHTLPPYLLKDTFPESSYLSDHGMNLPTSTSLQDNEIRWIVSRIRRWA